MFFWVQDLWANRSVYKLRVERRVFFGYRIYGFAAEKGVSMGYVVYKLNAEMGILMVQG